MHRYHLGIQSKGKFIASISKTNSIKSAWDNIAYELFLLQTGKKQWFPNYVLRYINID